LASTWQTLVVRPLREADQQALLQSRDPAATRKALFVLVSAALLLTLQNYTCPVNRIHKVLSLLPRIGLARWAETWTACFHHSPLLELAWWAVGTFVCWFVLPGLLVRFWLGERLADYGCKPGGAWSDAWIYGVFFLVMAPLVLLASADPVFLEAYPFYRFRSPLGWDLVLWEVLYAVQFVGVEFFFRGYLVHGTRERLGAFCIPVMTVPYCMIHFGKPWPETLGALVAGLVLGLMSLKNRSIVLGVVIHVSVAWSMDAAALWRRGLLD
jgi:membrane protease YdiL (CAAX protease family)